jgi:2-C-methyl-D-erythritol 2,4-cyclodiphosphate synthase
MRIGHGYDVHRYGDGDAIVVGGVSIAYCKGVIAHSDGDVLLHALCDALLGAAALGDIGQHFPDTDPQFKGIDSGELLRVTWEKVRAAGYEFVNADMTIVAQAPKMAKHIPVMRDNIAAHLQTTVANINVKATTTEKLGPMGREEGIAAHAVVLLK